jgi:hypothetical protein
MLQWKDYSRFCVNKTKRFNVMSIELDAAICHNLLAKQPKAEPQTDIIGEDYDFDGLDERLRSLMLTGKDREVIGEVAATPIEPWNLDSEDGRTIAAQFGAETVNDNASMARLALSLLTLSKDEFIERTRDLRMESRKEGEEEEPGARRGTWPGAPLL